MGRSDLDDGARMSNLRCSLPASLLAATPCNEAFALTTRRFGNDAFACGQVDATSRDHLVVFTLDGSEVWRKFHLKSFLRREPMLRLALCRTECAALYAPSHHQGHRPSRTTF